MKTKCKMNLQLLNAFINVVQEDGIPVDITTGDSFTDPNGDKMVDVLLEYDDKDDDLIESVLCNTINTTFGLV